MPLTTLDHQLNEAATAHHPMQGNVNKPTVLFLPASIRSHVLPSLYLAGLLAEDYEVVYAVTSDILAELVTKNGYWAVMNSENRALIHWIVQRT